MSKYIIDIPNGIEWGVVTCRTEDGFYTRDFDSLEELNSDYINEHFGELQDTAYQKGFEDGKKEAESSEAIEQAKADAFNKGMLFKEKKINDAFKRGFEKGKAIHDKGCEGCLWEGSRVVACTNCCNAYKNKWIAKDDKIEVGDEVEISQSDENGVWVVTKVEKHDDYEAYCAINKDGDIYFEEEQDRVTKTGRHFDIQSILEDMKHD